MPNLKFYFTAMRQLRSPMADFLIDCYFNGFCKGRKNFFLTPRYAKQPCAMLHSAELRLRAMRHSAEFKKQFYLRLRAMPPSAKVKSKIFLPTLHYAAQQGVSFAA
jgi:hypothetical protein